MEINAFNISFVVKYFSLLLGLLVALQQMVPNSVVVAFTDHQTKDLDLKDEILALKKEKNIEIYIILTPR